MIKVKLMYGKSHRFEYRRCKATPTPSIDRSAKLPQIDLFSALDGSLMNLFFSFLLTERRHYTGTSSKSAH